MPTRYFPFQVTDPASSNAPVAGLVTGNFTITTHRNGSASEGLTVIVSEVGTGLYHAAVTTVQGGDHALRIKHASYAIDRLAEGSAVAWFETAIIATESFPGSVAVIVERTARIPDVPAAVGSAMGIVTGVTGDVGGKILGSGSSVITGTGAQATLAAGHGLAMATALAALQSSVDSLSTGIIGNGDHAVTLQMLVAGVPVPGAVIGIATQAGALLRRYQTDEGAGRVSFRADAATYRIFVRLPGYSWDEDGYLRTVVGDGALDPITDGVQWSVSAPSDPGRCRVYLDLRMAAGPLATRPTDAQAIPANVPQFGGGYSAYVEWPARLTAGAVSGQYYFDDLYRGATYRFLIESAGIDAELTVPTVFTGGTPGIAYLKGGAGDAPELTVIEES